jgi:hypothetical protein
MRRVPPRAAGLEEEDEAEPAAAGEVGESNLWV